MRYLELRRHAMRVKPSKHLSQAGVTLARRIGETMGPFDQVVTSDAPRALETAVAMGYAVDLQMTELASFDDEVDAEVKSATDFASLARVIRKGGATMRFAKRQVKLWHSIMCALRVGGSVLVVSHGGIIELGAIACLLKADHAAWGAMLDYCEGVRLTLEDDGFTDIQILRCSGL